MKKSGFYKKEVDGTLNFAPNTVDSPKVSLNKENKDTYSYPADGWYWFETASEANAFFGSSIDIEEDEVIEG